MKRKFLYILAGLLIIGTAVFFYLHTIFVPIQLKRYVTTKAEKYLQREVSIGAIDFHPIKGFIIENISVARKDDPNQPFIQVKKTTFNFLLAPFFHKKAVIIPTIKIEDPFIYLGRGKNREWNFSDLVDFRKASKRKNFPTVLLRRLTLKNGEVHFSDKTQEEEFSESIQHINLDTTLSLNKGIRFIAEAQVPKRKATLKIKGTHSLLAKKLTAHLALSAIPLAEYLSLIHSSESYVHLTDGVISSADLNINYANHELQIQGAFTAGKVDVRIGESKQITGTVHVPNMLLTWRGKKWDAKGRIQLSSVHMTAASGKEFRGDITADLNLLTVFGKNMTGQGDVTVNNAHFKIDDNRSFSGNISADNASLSVQNDTIRLQGNFDVHEAVIFLGPQMSIKGNLLTENTQLTWSSPDKHWNRRLDVQSGLKMDDTQIVLGTDTSIKGTIVAHKFNLVYDKNKTTVETQGHIDHTDIALADNRRFRGNPHFNISFQYNPKSEVPVDYTGTINFTENKLTGIPYLKEIHNIEGVVTIMPDHIETDGLAFNTQGADIQLSGHLENFAKPTLDIKVSSENIDLQKLPALFPFFKKNIKAGFTGQADVAANYKGPLRSPADAAIKLTARLADATITHENLDHDITGVSGQLNYKNDHVSWSNLQGIYLDRMYTINGQLNNFSRPVIDTTVVEDQLALTTQVKILHRAFQLTTFTGDYLNTHFDLKGDVHLFEEAAPDIDLRGTFALDLRDIGTFVPRLKTKAKQFNPVGVLVGEGLYRGKFNDWRNWQLTFDAKSDKLKIKDYSFQDVTVRFDQRDQTISNCNVSSLVYGGDLKITSSADLRGEEIPFTATILLENLDLARVRKDKKLKKRNLAGTVSLSSNLQGEANSWRELTGDGSLSIVEGNLWQWNILSSISSALLIPEFKSSIFTEAHSDFSIGDQRIYTDNAHMKSKRVTFNGKGWIDFDQNLHFDITPTFSELAIIQSESMKKGPTSILTQTKGYLNIKLTGTLDDPQYHVEKFPMKIIGEAIGNTTETLKDVIGGIIEGIF